MPTINLAPLMAEVFMPILLMVIAPTVILIIVFSVIKLSIGNGIRNRKTKKAIWRWITLIFLIVFAVIGLPITISILKSISFEGYETPSEVASYISVPQTSSFSADEYLAPFFEAFEKGQADQEKAERTLKAHLKVVFLKKIMRNFKNGLKNSGKKNILINHGARKNIRNF